MKRQGLSAKPYQPKPMMNSSTQYNSATQPCCFIFDVMGWRLILNKMKVITDLNEIDRTTKEGRLLFAALAKITTESQTDKTPYEVLEQLEDLATKMDE
jgi:hypothetical protein